MKHPKWFRDGIYNLSALATLCYILSFGAGYERMAHVVMEKFFLLGVFIHVSVLVLHLSWNWKYGGDC